MKRILFIATVIIAVSTIIQACKKDTYNYTCSCTDPTGSLADTFINYNVPTSGQAFFYCSNFADTANKYGRVYECDLTK